MGGETAGWKGVYLSVCVVYTPTPHIYKYLGSVRVREKKKKNILGPLVETEN